MTVQVGDHFGDYRLTALLRDDPNSPIFQVEHRITKRIEAAKLLSAEYATETELQRFERELANHARLSHPNIASVYNALKWNNFQVLITEYVEGQTLEALLAKGPLPLETGIEYIRQALSALQYAHAQGVVHRNVSPANLIITDHGVVKLTNFGFAKSLGDSQLTNFGELVGTLHYVAPEQARGAADPDRRSDLYSVGAVLYQILTGRLPFGDNRLVSLLTYAEETLVPPTEIDARLNPQWNEIVGTALSAQTVRRYQSAQEFLTAVETLETPHLSPMSALGRSAKQKFSIGTWVSLAAACFIPLLVVSGVILARSHVAPPAARVFHVAPPETVLAKPAAGAKSPRKKRVSVASSTSSKRRTLSQKPVEPSPAPMEHKQIEHSIEHNEVASKAGAQARVESEPDVAPSKEVIVPQRETAEAVTRSVREEPTLPKKRKIWNKLNPFKKRPAAEADNPVQKP